MKKLLCVAAGALLIAASFGLTSCAEKGGKRCAYAIDAEYFPETRTLSADMRVDFVNTATVPLEEIKFELWANAYRENATYRPVSELFKSSAYYAGESYGGIEITGIAGAKTFRIGGEDANILSVTLQDPLEAGECASVEISFETQLAEVNHRLGVGKNTVNLANFYPTLCYLKEDGFQEYVYSSNGDPFVSEICDYEVTLTVPEEYTLVSGFEAQESDLEGKRAYHVREEGVRDVAFVLGKGMSAVSDEACGKEVRYYYFNDPSPETALKCACDALTCYSEAFCDYAYPRYTLVQTDFVYGGMEFPALSMISSTLNKGEMPAVVAHETAHQWWYAMVGSNQFEHAWQDEGLAEYSSALFFERFPDYGLTYADCISASEQSYRAFFSIHSQVTKEADTSMDRALTAYTGEYEYRNIAYDKGVILFDRVRELMGEKKFMNALSKYAKTYSGKIATPEQLISCFSKSGSNVLPVFESFTEGKCVI